MIIKPCKFDHKYEKKSKKTKDRKYIFGSMTP